MKLKDTELAVMAAVLFDAELPVASLARDFNISPTTARATLAKLLDRNILRYYPFINPYPLGYVPYFFYFTPVKAKEQAVKKYLAEHPAVSWLIRASGPYSYCAVFLCRTPFEFSSILQELGTKTGGVFLERASGLQTSHAMIRPRMLFPRDALYREFRWESVPSSAEALDRSDQKILSGLINRSYASHRDLARQLKIAPSTYHERIRQLVDRQVITAFVYTVNWAVLGYHSHKILVQARTPHAQFRNELRELMQREPHLYAFTECIGPWDFEIDLRSPQKVTAERFVTALTSHFGKLLGRVEILTFEERLKMTCYPFLEAE